MPFKEKTYAQLRAEWYKKLEKSGFQDAEDDQGRLKVYHSSKFMDASFTQTPEQMELTQAYYSMAGELLAEFPWKDRTHKTIWEFHCEGKTLLEICALLPTKRRRPLKKSQVDRIIKQYQQYIKD
jgi:hypothetical protein